MAQPPTAALSVESKGRRDIADEDFYRQKPLVFDFGARIVTLLDQAVTAQSEGAG